MSAASGRRWASPFPPTNSADERRYDDVTLAAPKTGGSGNWLLLGDDQAADACKDGGRLRLGDGSGQSDADSEFEADAGGGRVLFNLAPRGPWPSRGPKQQSKAPAADFDRLDNGGGYYMRRRQQPAVLHRAVHTHPLVASLSPAESPLGQQLLPQFPRWHHQLPTAGTTVSAPAAAGGGSVGGSGVNGSRSSKGFSLRRLLHIKPSSRRSVSRSRSSASATASAAMTTPQQSRSRPPSGGGGGGGPVNGKSLHTFAFTDTKMYHPHQQPRQQSGAAAAQLNGVNGAGHAAAAVRNSQYSADVTLGRNRPHPTPDYWRV